MTTLARISLGVFLALTTIVPMSAANASCLVTIYANRISATANAVVIYGSLSAQATFYYYGSTTNPIVASLLVAATSQHNRISLQGNAASCPLSGTARNIGLINLATISP